MHWSYGYCCGFTVVTNKCWDSDSKKSRRFFQEMNLGLCLSLWTMSQGCWKLESEKKSLFRNVFFCSRKAVVVLDSWINSDNFQSTFLILQHILYWVVVSNVFYFHPYLGKIPMLTNIFSNGLKPPTRIYLLHRKDVINVVTCMFITDSPYLNLSSNTISALSALRAFRLKKSHMTGAAWRIIPVSKWLIILWWWQLKYFFYFHPYLGKGSNLTHIFQMGWFNHQLVIPIDKPFGREKTHLEDLLTTIITHMIAHENRPFPWTQKWWFQQMIGEKEGVR